MVIALSLLQLTNDTNRLMGHLNYIIVLSVHNMEVDSARLWIQIPRDNYGSILQSVNYQYIFCNRTDNSPDNFMIYVKLNYV